jgi:hypothetical protein
MGCLHLGQRIVTAQAGRTNTSGKKNQFPEEEIHINSGNPTGKEAATKRWYLARGDTLEVPIPD